jgi:hypothetical protein
MTVNTTDLIVFFLLPGLVAFLKDGRIGQDVAVAAKTLWFWDIRR